MDDMTFVRVFFMFLAIRVVRAILRDESIEDFLITACIGITLLAVIFAISILCSSFLHIS